MRLTLAEVLEATGGELVAHPEAESLPDLTSFHTDSREVLANGLFFALQGAQMDGHRFLEDAAAHGASAAVVERPVEGTGLALVLVEDSWKALYALARWVLDKASPLVVGITGSNGKTSTKEMVAAVLGTRLAVLKSEGNLNTETGLPLTVLRLEPGEHEALVLEMGLQRAGDIARLTALARPRVGIVTGIGSVHLEYFNGREELARAKGELVAALPSDGAAVLNAEDDFFGLLAGMTPARVVSFGLEGGDYHAESYRPDGNGSSFSVRGVNVRLRLGGRHQVKNALAALAAGELAGVPLREGAAALAEVAVEHRLQPLPAAAGFVVIDDAYNASPESMLAAFETVSGWPRGGARLAVLGEMRELGELAEEAHRTVGRRAAEVFDEVCVVDVGLGRVMAEAAGAYLAPDKPSAVRWVRERAGEGSQVLVKASHGVALDEVVAELTA